MKILMNCLSSASGGAKSYLRNMLPPLVDLFEDSSCHSIQFLIDRSQIEALALKLVHTNNVTVGPELQGWRRKLWEQMYLTRVVRQTAADILFTPYQVGPKYNAVRQVLMIRNMEPFHFRSYRYGLMSRVRNHVLAYESGEALSSAERVIAVSSYAEKLLVEKHYCLPSDIRLIYHGRDLAFAPDGDCADDDARLRTLGLNEKFILTCGSMLPYRRYEDVISAFSSCAELVGDGVSLVIAGSGTDRCYQKKIQDAIESSPLGDRIIAAGHVSKADMKTLYRRCLVCIIATEIEACPNIAIEAMSSGCAIVSADRPPLPELFRDSSLEFQSRNISDLCKKILAFSSDDNLRNAYRHRALRRASDFSWKRCAAETYSALVDWN